LLDVLELELVVGLPFAVADPLELDSVAWLVRNTPPWMLAGELEFVVFIAAAL
jgi:hypothetical protein